MRSRVGSTVEKRTNLSKEGVCLGMPSLDPIECEGDHAVHVLVGSIVIALACQGKLFPCAKGKRSSHLDTPAWSLKLF